MRQLANWTFGAFFRALGRFLFFVVLGGLFAIIIVKSGLRVPDWLQPLYIVKADTVSYNYKQYRVQFYDTSSYATAWTSWSNFNTNTALSTGYGLSSIATRFGYSNKFITGTQYRFVVEVGFSPSTSIDDIPLTQPTGTTCAGSNSFSSWSNDTSLINQCLYVGATRVRGSNHVKFIFDVITSNDIQGVQFNISFLDNDRYAVNYVNVYNASSIYTGADIGGVIEEQTIIIQNEFDDISNTIIQNNNDLINSITETNSVCENYGINHTNINGALWPDGIAHDSTAFKTSDYLNLYSSTKIKVLERDSNNQRICFYTNTKSLISCDLNSIYQNGDYVTIPSSAVYFRYSVLISNEKPVYQICKNSGQASLDLLSDTDTSSDTNTIADDMREFNLSIEGPLTAILNIPIQLLDDLLVDYNSTTTHADLCFSLNSVESCIPSGDILWKRTARSGVHDNDYIPYWFGTPNFIAFRQFFELVVGGFLTYLLLKKLVNNIEKGLDPTISEVKIMKL